MDILDHIKSAIFGVAVGDALGVPVEFNSRERMKHRPVTDMIGHGTHNQPAGTWSDDSSLTFCLAETLAEGYDLHKLANRFVNWHLHNYWTPHGHVFDIGIATSAAIQNLKTGGNPVKAGGMDEGSNGNGSLMRILPLLFHIRNMPVAERFLKMQEVSSLTHAHIRSVISCFIYLEMALQLLDGKNKMEAFEGMKGIVNNFLKNNPVVTILELNKFHRLLVNPIGDYEIRPIYECPEDEIRSSGYVLSTLEASFWCFMTTDNYKDAVLKAVNLGSDTDTTAAVTGGLAGLYYGFGQIPSDWVSKLARTADIKDLCGRLARTENENYMTTTLFRPVGATEMQLIIDSGYKKFPPRLEWQPIFYPVVNEAYATQIALEWNTKDAFSGYEGHVLAFDLPTDYLKQYEVQHVGAAMHDELWIPAGELELFNEQIIGPIRVVQSFYGEQYKT